MYRGWLHKDFLRKNGIKNAPCKWRIFNLVPAKADSQMPLFQRISVPIHHAIAAMKAEAGIVKIQAQTMLPATPQRTADARRVDPTPTMAPVIVCVVDTGTPS